MLSSVIFGRLRYTFGNVKKRSQTLIIFGKSSVLAWHSEIHRVFRKTFLGQSVFARVMLKMSPPVFL